MRGPDKKPRKSRGSPSEETRKKLSKSGMGHEVSEETRKKIALAHEGKTMDEETKHKIAEAKIRKKIEQLGFDYREEDDDYYDEY